MANNKPLLEVSTAGNILLQAIDPEGDRHIINSELVDSIEVVDDTVIVDDDHLHRHADFRHHDHGQRTTRGQSHYLKYA